MSERFETASSELHLQRHDFHDYWDRQRRAARFDTSPRGNGVQLGGGKVHPMSGISAIQIRAWCGSTSGGAS